MSDRRLFQRLIIRTVIRQLRRKAWWLIAGLVLGAGVGTFLALRKGLTYKAHAAFVTSVEGSLLEQERLRGRDLILGACRQLPHLQVECGIKMGLRGKRDLYNNKPFIIRILEFPPHLRDLDLSFQFTDSIHYTLSVPEENGPLLIKGSLNQHCRLGAIHIFVEASELARGPILETDYYVRVHSEAALVDHISSKLDIYSSANRPERIEISYADRFPQRALDIVQAFTNTYREETERHHNQMAHEKISYLDHELQVLESEMQQAPTYQKEWHQFHMLQDGVSVDSLLLAIQAKKQYLKNLESHFELLSHWPDQGYDPRILEKLPHLSSDQDFQHQLRKWDSLSNLQPIPQAQLQEHWKLILTSLPELTHQDSLLIRQLRSELLELESRFQLRSNVRTGDFVKSILASEDGTLIQQSLDRMSDLQKERLEIQKELWGSVAPIYMTDAPYVEHSSPRSQQWRLGISATLGGGLLALLLIAISIYLSPNFQLQELLMQLPEGITQWQLPRKGSTTTSTQYRKAYTQLLLQLPPAEASLGIMGSTPERLHDLAQFLHASGKRFVVLQPHGDPNQPWPAIAYPSQIPGWWLSQAAIDFVGQHTSEYQLTLVILPDLAQVPEALGILPHLKAALTYTETHISGHTLLSFQAALPPNAPNFLILLES